MGKEYRTLIHEIINFIWDEMKFENNSLHIIRCRVFENSIIYFPPKYYVCKQVLGNLSKKYKLAIVSDTGFSPGTNMRKLMKKEDMLE